MKVCIYVRLSSYNVKDATLSPESQEARCRAYCKSQAWEVVEVVPDLNVSGSDKGLRLDRPGLKRVRELLTDVDVVIFTKLDRLARNVKDFRTFADECKAHGVALVSVSDRIDLTTPMGEFFATILAAFAELEAAVIAERGAVARADKVAARRWVSSVAPYGYVSVPHPEGKGRGLALARDEVTVLQEVAARVLRGEPVTAIARDLNERGVPRQGITPDTGKPSRKSGKWTASTLTRILRGDAILGRMRADGAPVLDPATGLPEVVWEPALAPAIVRDVRARLDEWSQDSEQGWRRPSGAVEDAEKRKRDSRPVRHRAERLLSGGVVVCGGCNRAMRTATLQGDEHYRCHSRGESIPCPAPTTVLASKVEDHLRDVFLARVGHLQAVRHVEGTDEAAVARLRDATDALEAVRAAIGHEDDDEALAGLLARKKALLATAAEAQAASERVSVRLELTGRTTAEEWEAEDVLGRRALLLGTLERVTVHAIGRGHHRRPVAERLTVVWGRDQAHSDYLATLEEFPVDYLAGPEGLAD